MIHHNCQANQLVGIVNRVCGKTLEVDPSILPGLRSTALRLANLLPKVEPEPLGEFALAYSGMKRARYLQAAEFVKMHGVNRTHAGVKAFVKNERMDPRIVTGKQIS